MQRRKLGTAVIWMICLLGMVAVVWSRPPLSSSRGNSHPPLALAAPAQDLPNPLPQDAELVRPQAELQRPFAGEPVSALPQIPEDPGVVLPVQVFLRDLSSHQISLKFEGQRLWVTVKGPVEEGLEVECTFATDYHLTKDGMLYGIITSAEITSTHKDPEERFELESFVQQFFDQPFAFRFRLDEGTLTIKEFKIATIGEDDETTEEIRTLFMVGSYRPVARQTTP